MSRFTKHAVVAAALLTLVGAPVAQAQNNPSAAVGVTLNATKKENLSLSAVTASVSLVAASGIADSSTANDFQPINVTTNWNLKNSTSVTLVGYFATPAQALLNGRTLSRVHRSRASCRLSPSARSLRLQGRRSPARAWPERRWSFWSQAVGGRDAPEQPHRLLNLRLNMTNAIAVAGDYTGTLNLRAIAQ